MRRLLMAVTPPRVAQVCDDRARRLLSEHFTVTWVPEDLSQDTLVNLMADHEVLVTSWGTPPLPATAMTADSAPSVVAHAAGSVRQLLREVALESAPTVFSGAPRIARSVGEYCLAATLTLLRRLPAADLALRRGEWAPPDLPGEELHGRRVGLVGFSATARAFAALLAPFNVEIVAYDPYLIPDEAAAMGIQLGELEDVMRSNIVSIHLPATPETAGRISAQLLASIPDGAIVINSARASCVDTSALLAEALQGRLWVALDVFDTEPPHLDPSVRSCAHLLLTPHLAGNTAGGRRALVGYVLDDAIRWLDRGERGPSWVDPARIGSSA